MASITGKRMKERRKELGLSAETVAKFLGVSPATVYRYERGDIEKLPGSILGPLSEILRTTPNYLMGWSDTFSSPSNSAPYQKSCYVKLYQRVKARRLQLGLTQEELAEKLGYQSKTSINKIELGKADIPQSKVFSFARALETTPAYLMGLSDNDQSPAPSNTFGQGGVSLKRESTATRLKYLMNLHHYKQVDILNRCKPYCEEYGVKMSKSDISQYVSGKVEPNQDKLFVLANALNVQEAWLMGYDVPMERRSLEADILQVSPLVLLEREEFVPQEGLSTVKFKERLRSLRKEAGLSQQELAELVGTSKSSINMYERGEREPGLNMLDAIADYFDVDMDYLLGRSDHRVQDAQPAELSRSPSPSTRSNYLYDRRKELGLTLKQVADAVGVSEATVSRWESGQIANMRRDRIGSYAQILKVTTDSIMTGEVEPTEDAASLPGSFFKMSIGSRIKSLRESAGLSQADLGKIAGVTDKAVSTWENDLKVPRMSALQAIANHFDVPKSYIIDGPLEENPLSAAQAEEKISKKKAALLFESGLLDQLPAGSWQSLAAIHRYLFEDIYDFAGQLRQVNLAKGSFRFAPALYLQAAVEQVEKMPQGTFDQIIEKYVEMNVAHPFREGNGRSTRIWLDQILRRELGQVIDWSQVDKEDYLLAMERSPTRDLEIKHLLRQALTERCDDREIYMKGIDRSYQYEGYELYRCGELDGQ